MKIFDIKFLAEDFLSGHNINYSEYTPILERKDNKFIIFEKGDIIIFNNKKYIYLGYVSNLDLIPKNINCFYKDGPTLRCRTYEKCKDEDVYRMFKKMEEEHMQEIRESMEKLDFRTKQFINSKAKNVSVEIAKKKREDNIRKECIEMLGGKCCMCGSTQHLSFVHRNPKDKIAPVSTLIKHNVSKAIIITEALKCELYCEPCRQEFFRRLQRKQYQSGERTKYKK